MAPRSIQLTPSDVRRFKHYLQRNEQTGCLEWTGYKNEWGYGRLRIGNSLVKVHRIAWVLAGREFDPAKPFILHNCDNPACCEPTHLWAGTTADNAHDMAVKGRGRKSKSGKLFGAWPVKGGFKSQVSMNGRLRILGIYSSEKEASEVALRWRNKYREAIEHRNKSIGSDELEEIVDGLLGGVYVR